MFARDRGMCMRESMMYQNEEIKSKGYNWELFPLCNQRVIL